MKRVVTATTWYAWNTNNHSNGQYSTMPGFTLEEAVDAMKKDGLLERGYIPMTAEEQKRWATACKKEENMTDREVLESMQTKFKYFKYLEDPESFSKNVSYSFWYTGAYGGRDSMIAYGADYADGYEFNLPRIAKRIGERNFYQFSTMKGKRVKSYSQLQNELRELGVDVSSMHSEDELKEACNEGSYYKLRK